MYTHAHVHTHTHAHCTRMHTKQRPVAAVYMVTAYSDKLECLYTKQVLLRTNPPGDGTSAPQETAHASHTYTHAHTHSAIIIFCLE